MMLTPGVYKSKINGHRFTYLDLSDENDHVFQSLENWKLYVCKSDSKVLNDLEFVIDRFEYLYGVNGTITKGDTK
jgi:hypothetical protein